MRRLLSVLLCLCLAATPAWAGSLVDGQVDVTTLPNTAVSPGSYTNSSLTVDQKGRLTAASSGTAPVLLSSHMTSLTGGTPAIGTCGTGTPSVTGNDNGGVITTGTSVTACTLTFSATLAVAPVCNFNTNLAAVAVGITSISTSAVVLAVTSTPAATIYYQCRLYQ